MHSISTGERPSSAGPRGVTTAICHIQHLQVCVCVWRSDTRWCSTQRLQLHCRVLYILCSIWEQEITSDNQSPNMSNGCTSHILFHVLYKDINNGQNYKNQCAGSPSLCTWVTQQWCRPLQVSLWIYNLAPPTFNSSVPYFFSFLQCHELQIFFFYIYEQWVGKISINIL